MSDSKTVKKLIEFAKNNPSAKGPVLFFVTVFLYAKHLLAAICQKKKQIIATFLAAAVVILCILFMPDIASFATTSAKSVDEVADSEDNDVALDVSDFTEAGDVPATHSDILSILENAKNERENIDSVFLKEEATDDKSDPKEEGSAFESDAAADDYDIGTAPKASEYDPDDWQLILVNKQNPVPDGYSPNLVAVGGSMQVDERIVSDLYDMFEAAKEDGINLYICSAYRSNERQTQLFERKIRKYLNSGYDYMNAYAQASMSVTIPGTSEHQLGLALDIVTGSYSALNEGFGDTDAGRWLAANAPDYGFILRYPKGKGNITGIIYEPWHFRYVGKEYSKKISDLGITLEEFIYGDY